MSLTVTDAMVDKAREGDLTLQEFVGCIEQSLPRAWQIIEGLVGELREHREQKHAVHAPQHMDDVQRGQLLRLLASSSMRHAVERFFNLRLEFQNCHKTAVFREEAIGSPEHRRFVSAEAQILAQTPDMLDC